MREGNPRGTLVLLALVSYGSLCVLRDCYWDDNLWLQACYASSSLDGFLDAGLGDLRRPGQGAILYALFGLHSMVPGLAPLVWHGLTVVLLLCSSLLLHRLLLEGFEATPSVALTCAAVFLVIRPDATFPIVSNTIYRSGMLLGLLSLVLTVRAIGTDRIDPWTYGGALLTAAVGAYVFMEGAMFYEPARAWLTLSLLRRRRGMAFQEALLHAGRCTVPFGLIAAPLVAMKLVLKPTGIYAGQYEIGRFQDGELGDGLLYLIDHPIRAIAEAVAVAPSSLPVLIALGVVGVWLGATVTRGWKIPTEPELRSGALQRSAGMLGGGALGLLLAVFVLAHTRVGLRFGLEALGGTSWRTAVWLVAASALIVGLARDVGTNDNWSQVAGTWRARFSRDASLLVFAGLMLVVPFCLYLVFGRVLGPGVNSRHACVLQIGYAILVGVALIRLLNRGRSRTLPVVAGSLVLGLGVAAVNATTVAYRAAGEERRSFVRAVEARLQGAPTGGLFVDAPAHLTRSGRNWTAPLDLDTNSDLELPINLLFAPTARPEDFLQIRVLTADLWSRGLGRPAPIASHGTHFGQLDADLRTMTFLRWRRGRLLINREIVEDDPSVGYGRWAEKPVPAPTWSRRDRPLRGRAPGVD